MPLDAAAYAAWLRLAAIVTGWAAPSARRDRLTS